MPQRTWSDYRCPMQRAVLKRGERRKGPLIAYDFETTRIPIAAGEDMRVQPLYLTAYGKPDADPARLLLSRRLYSDLAHSARILRDEFLTAPRRNARYVAWNGNRFDVRIVLDALVEYLPEFAVTPFWAGAAGLRGAVVYRKDDERQQWYFLDGIAMTGLTGWPLRKFMPLFAPEYEKYTLDFEHVAFDPENAEHVRYAERDSEGLYYGMVRADDILRELTGRGAQLTIGNAGIKYFQAKMPEHAQVWAAPRRCAEAIDRYGRRGGYVFTARPMRGAIWSYDINQAYAAAMRETDLPCGFSTHSETFDEELPGVYRVRISRAQRKPHPFYCKRWAPDDPSDGEPVECYGEAITTFITSDEYRYLRDDGWAIDVEEGWVWLGAFTMQAMVDELEALRSTCDGGPSGAIGTMVKMLGNNAYGKTGEVLRAEAYTLSKEPPSDEAMLLVPHDPSMRYFWYEIVDPAERRKRYHRPQLAMFITASVRCKLMRAIDACPEGFIKADTDSVTFDRPVQHLALSATRYGAWKVEHDGSQAIVIGKKCYAIREHDEWKYVVKGLRVRELTLEAFERWYSDGDPPQQFQVQTQGLKHGLGAGSAMYRAQVRSGADFRKLPSVKKRDEARYWWEAAWGFVEPRAP